MCGIVALWNRDGRPVDLEALETAVFSLRNRGPDDEGYVLIETATGRVVECAGNETPRAADVPRLADLRGERFDLALGHRRLAIVDLSKAGHQPMTSPSSQSWVVFNGMIHNFVELRRELIARRHDFRGGSDTEVLLAAYDEWGEDCVQHLNGMWAFVVWDQRTRRLVASRDRLGIKPLLVYADDRTAAFGSELKALRPLPGLPDELDPEAVHHYLSLMKVPAPHTIFRGIRKVMPGHSVGISERTLDDNRFWTPGDRAAAVKTDTDAVEEIDAVLRDSVRLRLQADVPVGALLSGGIDSSLITAVAAGQNGTPLKSYSAAFPEMSVYDESRWAHTVASRVKTLHRPIDVTHDVLADVPAMVDLFDEPFAVSSVIAVYVLARAAAREVKVLLTGDGGDELFAGYVDRYLGVDDLWKRSARHPLARFGAARIRAASAWVRWEIPGPWAKAGIALADVARPEQRRRDDAFNLMGTIFNEPEKAALYTPEWRATTSGISTLRTQSAIFSMEPGDRLRRWQLHDIRTALHDEMLAKVDKATAAWGIEARVPFLDHRLVELALNLAPNLKAANGEGKLALRTLGARYLPSSILRRKKQGFSLPLSVWLAGRWRSFVRDTLAGPALRRAGVFRPEVVERVLAHHDAYPSFHSSHMVFTLLCFQLWLERRDVSLA